MADEDKKDTNPQMVEMQQTMNELSDRLEQATQLIDAKNTEITKLHDDAKNTVNAKLDKDKNLKDSLGLDSAKAPKAGVDLNSLNNTEMLEIIADAVTSSVDANRTETENVISDNIKGLEAKFDGITTYLAKTEANTQLSNVKAAHSDFDKYQDAIKAVLKTHQSFSFEDAYDWVKLQESKGNVSPRHTTTEKPNVDLSAADEDVVRVKKPVNNPPARKRFYNVIEDAAAKVISRRGGQQ